ncbi:MAG TPA: hypothetical protein VI461_14875, partial [Chitinophagaceae bacterium]|nr:hypothetical protein [Chitinophagaceae bacterium]
MKPVKVNNPITLAETERKVTLSLKKNIITMQIRMISFAVSILFLTSCTNNRMTTTKPVQLITLDPGHFHAALVQKTMYDDVDSAVNVYAPEGNDLKLHLDRINAYNSRSESP